VVGAADAPEAADDALALAEDSGAVDVTAQLLGNDGDVDAGDTLKATSVQSTSENGGSVTVSPDGKVTYNPGHAFLHLDEGETATDSFTYTVTDSTGLTSTATATVTITGGPTNADARITVREDETTEDKLEDLESMVGFEIVGVDTVGTFGSVDFDGDSLTFSADHDHSDHLQYDSSHVTYFTVTGANGEKGLVRAVIEGVNDDIVAIDDAVAIGEGQATGNLWYTLIDNDQDVDSFLFEILSVDTSGTQGQVAFDPYNRTLTYSAANLDLAPGETITDSFTYEVDDGWGSTDTATVTVTITGSADGSAGVAMTMSSAAQSGPAFGAAPASAFLPAGGEAPAGPFGGESLMAAPVELLAGFDCALV
jgi:VCBS repeat-containing protein